MTTMPNKRPSAELCDKDQQTNEGSTPSVEKEDNTKRVKLDLPSDKTLQDLPIEVLQSILVRVVATEVKEWRLAKSAWKEKADLAIARLRNVSSQWNRILTADLFRNELQRTLNGLAQEKIRLETVFESQIEANVVAMTALKDEIFLLNQPNDDEYAIKVYMRDDVSKLIATIPLFRGIDPARMRACSRSNCVYVSYRYRTRVRCLSVLRISKDAAEAKFTVSSWIPAQRSLRIDMFSVSADGSLIILSMKDPATISVFNPDDSLKHNITFRTDIDVFKYHNLLQKANGNFIFGYVNEHNYRTTLLELDLSGSAVRKYESPTQEDCFVDFADPYGRIMIYDLWSGIELLDSELNPLSVISWRQSDLAFVYFDVHYESERNEIVRVHFAKKTMATCTTRVLTLFRFTSE